LCRAGGINGIPVKWLVNHVTLRERSRNKPNTQTN